MSSRRDQAARATTLAVASMRSSVKSSQPAALSGDDALPHVGIERELRQQFSGELHVFRVEHDAGAAERFGHGAARIGEHGHVSGHGFEQRHAEPSCSLIER